ncbi:Fc.00g109170.m01.CDS01 [Cosmosporella sp. VM-42]
MPSTPSVAAQRVDGFLPKERQNALCCAGYAKSKGRNCERIIGKSRKNNYLKLHNKLSLLTLSEAARSPLLEEAAEECLSIKEAAAAEVKVFLQDLEFIYKFLITLLPHQRQEELRDQAMNKAKASSRSTAATCLISTPADRNSGSSTSQRQARVYHVVEDSENDTVGYTDEEDDDSGDESEDVPSVWQVYDAKWKVLEEYGRARGVSLEIQIPWPVLAGKYADVTEDDVEGFYDNISRDLGSHKDTRKMIRTELQRWASRNAKIVFGKHVFSGVYAEELSMIYAILCEATEQVQA